MLTAPLVPVESKTDGPPRAGSSAVALAPTRRSRDSRVTIGSRRCNQAARSACREQGGDRRGCWRATTGHGGGRAGDAETSRSGEPAGGLWSSGSSR